MQIARDRSGRSETAASRSSRRWSSPAPRSACCDESGRCGGDCRSRSRCRSSVRSKRCRRSARAAVIGGDAGRQDQADAAAASRQLQRAVEEQLIAVRMSGGVMAVAPGGPEERSAPTSRLESTRSDRSRCRRAACPTADCRSRRRIRRSAPAARSRRRTLPETRAPSESRRDSAAIARARSSDARSWPPASVVGAPVAAAIHSLHDAGGRRRARPERRRAPRIGRGRPSGDRPVARRQRRQRALLVLDDVERIRRRATSAVASAARAPTRHRRADRRRAAVLIAARPSLDDRRLRQIAEPRADQAVAGGEVMIEKRQRPIRCQRRQPQRHARELHRGRIEIDAVQASFGDLAPQRGAIGSADIGRRPLAIANQRLLAAVRKKHARRDEKRAAAHRRIDDAQLRGSRRRFGPRRAAPAFVWTRNSVSACGV